jgi:hypothetical protein
MIHLTALWHVDWSVSGYYRMTDQVGLANSRVNSYVTHAYLGRTHVSDAVIQLSRIVIILTPHPSLYCCLDYIESPIAHFLLSLQVRSPTGPPNKVFFEINQQTWHDRSPINHLNHHTNNKGKKKTNKIKQTLQQT